MLIRSRTACLIVFGMVLTVSVRADAPTTITFDSVRVGTLPAGFKALSSDNAAPGRWQVVKMGEKAALAQIAGTTLHMGPGDRAAGIAWRVHDAGTYYAARLDLAQNEFVLYKFVRGNRVRLSRLSNLRLSDSDWHELTIEHKGEQIRVWLNGIPVASERDDALPEAGMVGLWMPADSTAQFKRLWYQPARGD